MTAIISAGLTFTLVVGEFDLSIGNVASFIGLVVAGIMAKERLPIPAASCSRFWSGSSSASSTAFS